MATLNQALNALDIHSATFDRPSYVQDPEEELLKNQLEALQQSYAQHGTIGPDPLYDEEGNIKVIKGYPPDIALAPLMSRTSLAAVGSKMKSFFSKSPAHHTANLLMEVERKISPSMAKKVEGAFHGKGYPSLREKYSPLTATKFANFVEAQTRKGLLRKLSTPKEYARFKKTFPDAGKIFKYDDYKTFLEMELYPSKKLLAEGAEWNLKKYKPHIPERFIDKNITGRYYTESGQIVMRPSGKEGGLSGWKSTLRHELKHHLDFRLTDYGTDDYARLRKVFDEGLKPKVKEELLNWKLLQALGGKVGKRIPGGVRRINYLKEPTETLARLTEIRTKGVGQTISTLLGRDITALEQLKSIYRPEFLKTLMKDYWAIAPIGLGMEAMDDEMYKDLK